MKITAENVTPQPMTMVRLCMDLTLHEAEQIRRGLTEEGVATNESWKFAAALKALLDTIHQQHGREVEL